VEKVPTQEVGTSHTHTASLHPFLFPHPRRSLTCVEHIGAQLRALWRGGGGSVAYAASRRGRGAANWRQLACAHRGLADLRTCGVRPPISAFNRARRPCIQYRWARKRMGRRVARCTTASFLASRRNPPLKNQLTTRATGRTLSGKTYSVSLTAKSRPSSVHRCKVMTHVSPSVARWRS